MIFKQTIKFLSLVALVTTLSIAQKEALIVGISDYRGEKDDLGGIEKDIEKMKNLFQKKWGFHVKILWNAQSMQIGDYLEKYAKTLKEGDVFGLYYSGHGSTTFDKSGDEDDRQDETIVLSDGNQNAHFLDDSLYGYLNEIKAKKIVIFDSCHSGTAFKTFGNKPKPKSITSKAVTNIVHTKAFRRQQSKPNSGEYIILSASQDSEESLATKSGSLFTNAIYKEFTSSNGNRINFMDIKNHATQDIVEYCNSGKLKVHHPKLSTSNNKLKYISISDFLKTKKVSTIKQSIKILGKKEFKEGELLNFTIDTKGNRGYLTIFSIEKGKPFIMAKTVKPVSGILNFQQDFSVKPPIECYKSCTNCKEEVSSIYIILSERPLSKNVMQTKGLQIENTTDIGKRAFRHKTNDSFEPIIARAKFIIK